MERLIAYMNVHFISLGCKVNQYETECIKEKFISEGFDISDDNQNADVIIINSCTVTSSGDNKSLKALKQARRFSPDAVIVLTGCMPQAASKNEIHNFSEADIITGTKNKNAIPDMVKRFLKNREAIVDIEQYKNGDSFEDMKCGEFKHKTRAFVKIQDGCNQFCSYCIIPYARGRCRSKPLDKLKCEIEELAKNGHKEIVLVGINLAFYGRDLGLCLADAAEVCCKTEGIERVRLSSIEPEIITDDDLKRLASFKEFCPHFHLSLQSGCDKILKAMNRHYTCEEYYDLVCRIRKFFPDASITTDIMTGFPGETEEDFEETVSFARKIGFAKIHVFPYSIRPGTRAAQMPGQLCERIKTQRAKILKETAEKLSEDFHKSMIGKTFPVLFERERTEEFHQGHTPNYILVKIPKKNFEKSLRRRIFCVKIIESDKDCCTGEIV